ncbi:MAG TPA: HNH endonuclease signature motif containing protein [Steroidobacteraceae bacterium]|nr:HNH endonuclease signature motif containing protein [Steroidobacteraceae bacterium]
MSDGIQPRLEYGSELLPPDFWDRVKVQRNGCWHWTGRIEKTGYGDFRGKAVHRLTYAAILPIPEGFVIDHLCHNPKKCNLGKKCPHRRCCNPEHLEAVTNEENVRRGNWHISRLPKTKAAFSQCPQGHWRVAGKSCYECVRTKRAAMMREIAERREAFRNRPLPKF